MHMHVASRILHLNQLHSCDHYPGSFMNTCASRPG